MTRPDSSGSPGKPQRPKGGSPPPEPDRRLAAVLGGGVAGGVAFLALLLLGILLYQRLWGNSTFALTVIAIVFGAAGLYAGWLAAMMVFSAIGGEQRP